MIFPMGAKIRMKTDRSMIGKVIGPEVYEGGPWIPVKMEDEDDPILKRTDSLEQAPPTETEAALELGYYLVRECGMPQPDEFNPSPLMAINFIRDLKENRNIGSMVVDVRIPDAIKLLELALGLIANSMPDVSLTHRLRKSWHNNQKLFMEDYHKVIATMKPKLSPVPTETVTGVASTVLLQPYQTRILNTAKAKNTKRRHTRR